MIVVMTQREKIGMEAMFRRSIPPHKRDGSQFVFRQARPSQQRKRPELEAVTPCHMGLQERPIAGARL